MISSAWLLGLYCLLVLLASLAGGWLPLLVKLTHTRLQMAISLVAGLMLGIALLHFLPDAAEQLHSLDRTVTWVLGGFLAMFFLQRFFHFHHHDLPDGDPEDCCHEHEHHHDHGHEHAHTLADKSARQLSWVGTALGLSLHSLLDGLALAAAVEAGAKGHAGLAGFGVALAVILHKPFDAMAVSTLMTAGGSSRFSRQLLNALFALATPLGAGLFYLGANQFADSNAVFLGCALAFCAGTFLCIACSDLLPELQFHSHDRFKLSLALVAGLVVAVLIRQIEAAAKQATTDKDTAIAALLASASQLSTYVHLIANGDQSKILSAGMQVRSAATPTTAPNQVMNLAITSGDSAGELDLQSDTLSGAKTCGIQTSPDPMTATSWTSQPSVTKSKAVILGLTSGQRVWTRVRAVNSAGQGAWSDPATKIVP